MTASQENHSGGRVIARTNDGSQLVIRGNWRHAIDRILVQIIVLNVLRNHVLTRWDTLGIIDAFLIIYSQRVSIRFCIFVVAEFQVQNRKESNADCKKNYDHDLRDYSEALPLSSLRNLARILVCWPDLFPFQVRASSRSYRCRAA